MAKPLKCSRCGRENDPSFAFCLDCGQRLEGARPPAAAAGSTCAACGARLQPGFRFCGHCGAPIGATPPRPGAGPTGTGVHGAAPPPTPAPPPPEPQAASPAAPAAERLQLAAVRSDGLPGAVVPVDREEIVCGRSEGALRLGDDPAVSPRHARFTFRRGVLAVEDLGSASGTFLRIRAPRRIGVGEELRVGRQVLRVEPLPRPAHAEERGVRAWGAPDPGCRFRLTQLLEGGGVGEVFPLREGENAVGREIGEVTFPGDRYVSARHARVEVHGDGLVLADAGSSNGTFVRIAGAVELAPGDQLLIGAQLVRVEG